MSETLRLSLLVCKPLFLALSAFHLCVCVSVCPWAAVCITMSPGFSLCFPFVSGPACPWVAVLMYTGGRKNPEMLVHPAPPWVVLAIGRIREK